jgi:hypothetical protein
MKRFYLFFNRVNLTKIFIIFSFGFMSRFFVNYFSDVNVFVDYTNFISLAYYIFMSIFVVLVHELVSFFNLSISPNFSNKIILGYFDSTPSCPLSGNIVTSKDGIKDIKEIKVVSSLFMESDSPGSVNSVDNNFNYRDNLEFKDRCRRFIHWNFGKLKNNSCSYKDFKYNWDPDIKLRKLIVNDLKSEFSEKSNKFNSHIKTFKWFIDRFRGRK